MFDCLCGILSLRVQKVGSVLDIRWKSPCGPFQTSNPLQSDDDLHGDMLSVTVRVGAGSAAMFIILCLVQLEGRWYRLQSLGRDAPEIYLICDAEKWFD